jgi:hypothetical protein
MVIDVVVYSASWAVSETLTPILSQRKFSTTCASALIVFVERGLTREYLPNVTANRRPRSVISRGALSSRAGFRASSFR